MLFSKMRVPILDFPCSLSKTHMHIITTMQNGACVQPLLKSRARGIIHFWKETKYRQGDGSREGTGHIHVI